MRSMSSSKHQDEFAIVTEWLGKASLGRDLEDVDEGLERPSG